MGSFPQHTTTYKDVQGIRRKVPKIPYATRVEALASIERLLADPKARLHPMGYNAYRCQHCGAWHVGRDGMRRRRHLDRTERTRVLMQLYWALWRRANGKPTKLRKKHSGV